MTSDHSRSDDAQSRGEMSEAEIDETLEGTFPASDPPSWTLGTDHRSDVAGGDPQNTDEQGWGK
jgi:hypothetical protein